MVVQLSNPKDGSDAKEAEMKRAAAKVEVEKQAALEKAKEKKFAEPKGPIKPASEDDIQFVQAMNVLKGLPVETTPSEEVKEAEAIPK